MKKTNKIYQMICIIVVFIAAGARNSLLSMSQPAADETKSELPVQKHKHTVHFKTPTMIFIQKTTKHRPYNIPLFNSLALEHKRKLKSLCDMAHTMCEEDVYPEELISIPPMPTPVLGKAPISDIRHSASCDISLANIAQQPVDKTHAEFRSRLSKISGLVVRQCVVKPLVQTSEEKLKSLFKHLS
ncbi:MAG: hypothetical protein US69_C0005G0008 [candidate division TM6 bacterium GW2011_GWF2_38_10]|nr:MAG: hypothetical protein US69_C0005G0008 [candidate division TM6 bacterium GW2011_GWF2_38_10]